MENLIFEIHSHNPCTTNTPTNLYSLIKQQKTDAFCRNKVKQLQCHKQTDLKLDDKGVLRKTVCLCHNWTSTVVVPKSIISSIIYEYHKCRGHQGITRTVNMICRYFWWPGMRSSIYQHIKTCKLSTQFIANKLNTKPMHLENPQVPFAGCAVDTKRLLPTTSKNNKYMLTFMCFLMSYLIAVPLMTFIKHILPITSCSTLILQDNGTEFKNVQLIASSKSLGIKPIYSNPYRPEGNSRLETCIIS